MIRKAIIVVLTLVTILLGVLLVVGSGWRRYSITANETVWIGSTSAAITVHYCVYGPPEIPRMDKSQGFGHSFLGFEYKRTALWTPEGTSRRTIYKMPSVMVLIVAVYPAVAFIRGPLRRYRRKKRGLCIRCGYDLEGNVSGVCPECGGAR